MLKDLTIKNKGLWQQDGSLQRNDIKKKYYKTFLFIFKRLRIENLSLKLSKTFIFKTLDPEWYKVHSRPRMVQSSPTESQNDCHQNITCLISYRIVYHDNRFREKKSKEEEILPTKVRNHFCNHSG